MPIISPSRIFRQAAGPVNFPGLLCAGMTLFILLLNRPTPILANPPPAKPTLDTLLEMSLEELVSVEITTATRRPIPVSKAPAIATVLTHQEIINMGARNLTDILKMIPGFGVSIFEFGVTMFEVRGIRTQVSDQILVMVDGHSLNRNFAGSGLYLSSAELPVENISRVEVIRGPGSALYGANAFVAVVNVITRKAAEVKGLEITASGGSNDSRRLNLTGGREFTSGLNLSGSLDLFKTSGEDHLIEADATFGTPWAGTPGNTDSRAEDYNMTLQASYGDWSFNSQFYQLDRGLYIGLANVLTDDNSTVNSGYWAELAYRRKLTEKLGATIKLYHDYYEQETMAEVYPEGFLGLFPDGMFGGPHVKVRTNGGEMQFDYDLASANHAILGLMYEKMVQYDVKAFNNFYVDPTAVPPLVNLGSIQDVSAFYNWMDDASREIWAVYLQDEWKVVNNLNLTAGLRYDHYSEFGGTANPRVGAVWGFLHNADLKLLYGRAFRAPSFNELYVKNNPVNIGNRGLNPEIINTYEAGVEFRPREGFAIEVNYFNNQISDLIVWDTSRPAPYPYINAGKAEVDGVELGITGRHTADNYWKLSYTYQDPRDGLTHARLPNVPYQRGSLTLNYGLTQYLNLHTDLLWTGRRPRMAGDSRPDMPSYATVDLALILKNLYKTMEVRASIHNLLDKNYRDPDTSGAARGIPNDYPRDGISVLVGVHLRL